MPRPAASLANLQPAWTPETARLAAARSNAVQAVKRAAKPPKQIGQIEPQPPEEDYSTRKLARVRGQIEQVESLLDDADEPQAVDRYAAALSRLYEIERILAGRPLPGSMRPTRASARGAPPSWLESMPPAAVTSVAPVAQVAAAPVVEQPPVAPTPSAEIPPTAPPIAPPA